MTKQELLIEIKELIEDHNFVMSKGKQSDKKDDTTFEGYAIILLTEVLNHLKED